MSSYRFVAREAKAYTMYVNDLPVAVLIQIHGDLWAGLSLPDGHQWTGATRKAVADAIVEEFQTS